jgi:SAM-dependent methyltransferase
MKIIRSIAELDEMLAACDGARSDDALRAVFSEFAMDMALDVPQDPFSPAYYDYQMTLYRRISGREYSLDNEATPFDVEQAVVRPFPYSTGSCQTAGDHYVTIGHFLQQLRLPPNARIVEFGPGWGNVTLALAALGYHVTAVDVEARYCELISRRASRLGLSIDTVNADFSWAATVTEPFDAIIFFECFHHAADHRTALRNLHKALKPGGRVYMGAEPIVPDFPIPWGLRMDGQSLWSIRKFGWMELGFRDDYFQQVLAVTGWRGVRHQTPGPAVWELQPAALPWHFAAADNRLGSITGERSGSSLVFTDAEAGPALFGLYVPLPQGSYRARIYLQPDAPRAGGGDMQVCAEGATKILANAPVDTATLSAEAAYFELPFTLDQPYDDLEVRFLNAKGFRARMTAVEILEGQGNAT